MRTVALQVSSADHARWGGRRESYADGSSAAFLCLGRFLIKASLGPARGAPEPGRWRERQRLAVHPAPGVLGRDAVRVGWLVVHSGRRARR